MVAQEDGASPSEGGSQTCCLPLLSSHAKPADVPPPSWAQGHRSELKLPTNKSHTNSPGKLSPDTWKLRGCNFGQTVSPHNLGEGGLKTSVGQDCLTTSHTSLDNYPGGWQLPRGGGTNTFALQYWKRLQMKFSNINKSKYIQILCSSQSVCNIRNPETYQNGCFYFSQDVTRFVKLAMSSIRRIKLFLFRKRGILMEKCGANLRWAFVIQKVIILPGWNQNKIVLLSEDSTVGVFGDLFPKK